MLDRNGELTRTHGGAVLRPGMTVQEGEAAPEEPYNPTANAELKARLAAAAVAYVQDGSVVLLDIGATAAQLARLLHGRDITVVTANLVVFDELRNDPSVRLILLGGIVRRNMQTLVGSLAQSAVGQISADVAFLSCTGIRADGRVVDDMLVESPVKHAFMTASSKVVLMADVTKFPGTGALRICSVTDVDVLVVNDGTPEGVLELCRDGGGEVVVA